MAFLITGSCNYCSHHTHLHNDICTRVHTQLGLSAAPPIFFFSFSYIFHSSLASSPPHPQHQTTPATQGCSYVLLLAGAKFCSGQLLFQLNGLAQRMPWGESLEHRQPAGFSSCLADPLACLLSVAGLQAMPARGWLRKESKWQRRMEISPIFWKGDFESESEVFDPFSCAVILHQLCLDSI